MVKGPLLKGRFGRLALEVTALEVARSRNRTVSLDLAMMRARDSDPCLHVDQPHKRDDWLPSSDLVRP